MNRRPPGLLFLAKAGEGFLQYKLAEGLSPRTLTRYKHFLKLWVQHTGNVPIDKITPDHLRNFLIWLRLEYKPLRITGTDRALSNKTIRNIYMCLSSFFTWASHELNLPNPLKGIPAPRFEQAPVEPFTKEQIETLLKACQFSQEAHTVLRRKYTYRRINVHRDQAIILMLLDTGLRASELGALKIGDVDIATGKVLVKHGRFGGAKGGKGRTVYLGKVTRRALWRYLAGREDGTEQAAPLFVDRSNRPLSKNLLGMLMRRLGEKTGIQKCRPPRFRHTFAIPIFDPAETSLLCKRYSATVPSRWFSTMRASPKSIFRKRISEPAQPTIGAYDPFDH